MTRSLGLDIGDKKIGIALSDPGEVLASPFTIIDRTETSQDIEAVLAIIADNEVGKVITGLPLSMDGSVGPQAQKVKAFIERLTAHTEIPVEFRDERLTTVYARRLMQTGGKKKGREKKRDDAIAAAIILQGYLDESYS